MKKTIRVDGKLYELIERIQKEAEDHGNKLSIPRATAILADRYDLMQIKVNRGFSLSKTKWF
jgi:hypothetical protein